MVDLPLVPGMSFECVAVSPRSVVFIVAPWFNLGARREVLEPFVCERHGRLIPKVLVRKFSYHLDLLPRVQAQFICLRYTAIE